MDGGTIMSLTSRATSARPWLVREGQGYAEKKCHETETQLGVATRETAVNLQVREDQHVTRDEILQVV